MEILHRDGNLGQALAPSSVAAFPYGPKRRRCNMAISALSGTGAVSGARRLPPTASHLLRGRLCPHGLRLRPQLPQALCAAVRERRCHRRRCARAHSPRRPASSCGLAALCARSGIEGCPCCLAPRWRCAACKRCLSLRPGRTGRSRCRPARSRSRSPGGPATTRRTWQTSTACRILWTSWCGAAPPWKPSAATRLMLGRSRSTACAPVSELPGCCALCGTCATCACEAHRRRRATGW